MKIKMEKFVNNVTFDIVQYDQKKLKKIFL